MDENQANVVSSTTANTAGSKPNQSGKKDNGNRRSGGGNNNSSTFANSGRGDKKRGANHSHAASAPTPANTTGSPDLKHSTSANGSAGGWMEPNNNLIPSSLSAIESLNDVEKTEKLVAYISYAFFIRSKE